MKYQTRLDFELSETTAPVHISCQHLIEGDHVYPLFSNFSTDGSLTKENSSNNTNPLTLPQDTSIHWNTSFLPLKQSGDVVGQLPIPELPSIVTGSVNIPTGQHIVSSPVPAEEHASTSNKCFQRDLSIHVENVVVSLS